MPEAPPPDPSLDEDESRGSSVRLRVAPARESATFLAWAQEQVVSSPMEVSEEVRRLENQLISALRARDHAQALLLASTLVYANPQHEVARRIKARCAQNLRGATKAFPRHDAIPRMRLAWYEMEGRNLSQRAAYILSCVDGFLSVEQLIDVSAMSPLVAYDLLDNLVRDGIIELT
jgi:hypothetical protein